MNDPRLPHSLTFTIHQRSDGKWVAHALEFDLVIAGTTRTEAVHRLRLSVAAYADYGLDQIWGPEIVCPAHGTYWKELSGNWAEVLDPIIAGDGSRMEVYLRNIQHLM